jgi:chitin synthase
LNGAFFAAVYSLLHFKQIWRTDHTIARKILLHIEFVYQFVQLLFTFFSLANFYLTFYFIAGSLADPQIDPFGHNFGLYIFTFLRYVLVLLIMMQFILSMGNRPQGAKKMFMGSLVAFSVVMVYNTFAALYIVIKQLSTATDASNSMKNSTSTLGTRSDDNTTKAFQDQLTIGNNVFTNLVVSTLSTVGLYFLMSFLYLDPWHMFTSSAQYFALLPGYVCTLQVYAFCNAHDVTWGTKGDNVLKTDLGIAKISKDGTVEVEMPSEQLDIDSGYDEALRNLRDRVEVPKPPIPESQLQEDYYRGVRTYLVIVWLSCNAVLAMIVSEVYSNTHVANNTYLKCILWSVAGLALFRAIGSCTFGVINIVQSIADGKMKFLNGGGSSKGGSSINGAHSVGGFSSKTALTGWMSNGSSWISSRFGMGSSGSNSVGSRH